MAVIGNSSTQQAFTPAVDYFSGNASTTAFTLSRPVASVAQVEAVIDNVVQNPSSAYTVSGNTITFTSAPLSGTNNIYVRYTSPITQVIAPGQGTVTSTSMVTGAVGITQLSATGTASSSTYLRGDNTWATVATPSAATQTALGTVYGKQDTSGLAFYGYQAANSTTGVNTTAIGYQALYSNTTGTNNTIIGAGAGYAITSTNHVAIGRNANTASTNGDRCTVIGSAANPSASSTDAEIVIGYGVTGQADSYITMGSNLGKIYNAYKTNATWTQTSDGRLKKNIQPDTLGLSFVCRLNPVTYQWKPSNEIDKNLPYYNETNERDTETVMHGFVAQEVKAALDAEMCSTFNGWDGGNHEGIQAISREMFISPLVNAIKELKALVDAQATEIAELKAKVGV